MDLSITDRLFSKDLQVQLSLQKSYSLESKKNQTQSAFLKVSADTFFVVWGDLYGSFHALVNALSYLRKEGIIDENLHIIKPNYYFIFLGNVIDRSSRGFDGACRRAWP